MMEDWNSTEQFQRSEAGSGAEGMECGSLDRIQNSEGQMDVMLVAAVQSDWQPAGRFWASFQMVDLGSIFDIAFQTPCSLERFEQDVRALQKAPARTHAQRLEKRKAAACLELVGNIIRVDQAGRDQCNLLKMRVVLSGMILRPVEKFDESPADEPAFTALVNGLLSGAPKAWIESLARDVSGLRPDKTTA